MTEELRIGGTICKRQRCPTCGRFSEFVKTEQEKTGVWILTRCSNEMKYRWDFVKEVEQS